MTWTCNLGRSFRTGVVAVILGLATQVSAHALEGPTFFAGNPTAEQVANVCGITTIIASTKQSVEGTFFAGDFEITVSYSASKKNLNLLSYVWDGPSAAFGIAVKGGPNANIWCGVDKTASNLTTPGTNAPGISHWVAVWGEPPTPCQLSQEQVEQLCAVDPTAQFVTTHGDTIGDGGDICACPGVEQTACGSNPTDPACTLGEPFVAEENIDITQFGTNTHTVVCQTTTSGGTLGRTCYRLQH